MMKVDEDDTMFGADNDFSLPVNEEPYNPAFRPPAEVDKEEEGITPFTPFTPFMRPYKERYPQQSAWCDTMVAGAVAGGIGSYVTNPLDVLKTRLQTDSSLYKGSIVMCARATMKEGGAMAFLRGSVPRLLHKIPANGAFFLFYEFFGRLLHVEGVGKE
jgi:hypothetical protein